ncbi:MAG: MFS transporter [Firmicutes bacterium HGW-Firmicutes-7]|nr:MAG: MFS transporter [Firmicutes bacterium HGW-Firmicutes-7]
MQKKIALKLNRYLYYGWYILILSSISTFFSSPGQTYSISVFIDSYIAEFNYSRTLISSIYSIATVLSGILMIFVGKAVDRFGPRFMLVFTGIMLAFTCFFNSFIFNIPMIFIGFFLLRFFGQGSLTLIPGSLVPQWFDKRKAFAISLLTMGTIIGNMFVPAINHFIIGKYSWVTAWRSWGLLLLIGFVPLMWFFIINKPEDIHLLPDNKPKEDDHSDDEELQQLARTSFNLAEALRTKEFWFLGIISMIIPMISTGMMFHFFSLMATKHIAETATAYIIGLVALPGFLIPLIAGVIIDRYRSKHILFAMLGIIMIDLLFMLTVNSILEASIFILVYGLATNIQNVTTSVIWVKYFGRLHLGSIRGAATVFTVVGSAFGTIPFGLSYDLTGGYSAVFIAMSVAAMLGMIMTLSIRKPIKADLLG